MTKTLRCRVRSEAPQCDWWRAAASVLAVVRGEEFQQFLDGHVCLCWMAKRASPAEDVARASAVAFVSAQVAVMFEVGDDALHGAFGDVAGRGDVARGGERLRYEAGERFGRGKRTAVIAVGPVA
ncbi:hypothetical protein ABTZ93_39980 [Streptomyces sp. NPDC097941]|uniref:hypothetical protein n=1 Tax=Streptomyces sp. NPDC097941 TaxID=3155685 RepID=UPI00332D9A6E